MKHRYQPTPSARANTRRRAGTVLLTGSLMLGGGAAWAAWSNSGTGTATAQATTATALLVGAGSPVGTLYPKPAGGYPTTAVGSIYTTVSNPNDYPVKIVSVTVGIVTATPLAARTCAAGSVVGTGAGTPVLLATPITLAANASSTPITIPGAIEMIASAEDGCQAASFAVPVTLTAATA